MNRRGFIHFMSMGSMALLLLPRMSFGLATDRRFIFIIQRGAADGLNTVIPYADPHYARLRGALAIDPSRCIHLDSYFALHPSLQRTGKMFANGQAAFVHAVASPYRDRSHFDAQNVLETGGALPYQHQDGWMNRLLGLLPVAEQQAIALAHTVPMALRGAVSVASYAPSRLPQASDDLLMRVSELYAHDIQLYPLWREALSAQGMTDDASSSQDPENLGALAASFMVQTNGPRLAMLETSGWDTHSAQEIRLSKQLQLLDRLLDALRIGLGDVWQKTTVFVATEFGRTAAANGTGGTDHGTASVAMLLGGDLRGGRVISDWPGLSPGNLYQDRDLRPTLGLDTLLTAILSERFSLDTELIQKTVFGDVPVQEDLKTFSKNFSILQS